MNGPDTPARLGMLVQHDAGPHLIGCRDLGVGETDVRGVDFGVVGEFHRSNPRLLPPVAVLKGNIVGIHGLMFRGRVTRGIRGYQRFCIFNNSCKKPQVCLSGKVYNMVFKQAGP